MPETQDAQPTASATPASASGGLAGAFDDIRHHAEAAVEGAEDEAMDAPREHSMLAAEGE